MGFVRYAPLLTSVRMKNQSAVKTIDRLVTILSFFSREQPTWSLAELSTHLSLPKFTIHRFLTSLEAHGILRRDPDDLRWHLGCRLFIWGRLVAGNTGLGQLAKPIMRELVNAAQETAILTVYVDKEVVCVDKVETSHPVRLTLDVGARRFPLAGASSKALMAYFPEEEIQAIIREKGLPRLCRNTITDADELKKELPRIRDSACA